VPGDRLISCYFYCGFSLDIGFLFLYIYGDSHHSFHYIPKFVMVACRLKGFAGGFWGDLFFESPGVVFYPIITCRE